MKTTRTAVKFGVFLVVAVLASVLVVNTITDPISGPTHQYQAVFTDAQGLIPGSDVRIAGARVGKVTAVALHDAQAVVSFEVQADQRLPGDSTAAIRYADLLGARYLALSPGDGGGGELPDGATIPLARTTPPVDLTALLAGFKPLFNAINPSQVNQLAGELIGVFQGESGNLTGLLNQLITVTAALTSRDQVIGALVSNLNSVLATVNDHRDDLATLIDRLSQLASAVVTDRPQIVDALQSGGALASSLTHLLAGLTPTLSHDVTALGGLATTLTNDRPGLDTALHDLPALLTKVNAINDYGSWVNIYVCNLSVLVAGAPIELGAGPHSEVCP